MATPLSADRLLKALRDEGLTVHEVRSWRTHNRNAQGAWAPVHGVMIHHTVTSGTDASVRLCYDGHSTLPGPLCHGVIDKAGEVHLVGHGRANHAGSGDGDVLDAVIAERELPPDNRADTDGNPHFYGFECVNLGDGEDPWPDAQLLAIERAAAAVCRAHGWNHRSVIGHLEWQPGKIDPRGFTMDAMRERVRARLGEPPDGGGGGGSPTHEPFPGAAFFAPGRESPIITAMGERLVAEGCGRYQVGPGPEWTAVDQESYAAWQRKLGYSGGDADGIPGETSWDRLRVPRV
ncbi:peptidoglycan-binding protein [Streptomyces sedi]|uniref:N-acetylmuramoyl-L-alanine amidase n=1 Tax=Streptomyces sedi TaxID=555059 RepID=A0A5C4V1S1_9ACTN|nr:peptidoglycan-binding protein [Streptomyces sedi]TNM29901.1 N-acetylmuramoyl-L-alanine amidase [Streptomyces sedi]